MLKEQLKTQIEQEAEIQSGFSEERDCTPISKGHYYGYIYGATTYATKLQQLQEENDNLKAEFRKAIDDFKEATLKVIEAKEQVEKERDELKSELDKAKDISLDLYKVRQENEAFILSCNSRNATIAGLNTSVSKAKDLLHEVFQKHETGLLPDRFVYEKIKSFLYPENNDNGAE